MVADALMLNFALALSLLLRFAYAVVFEADALVALSRETLGWHYARALGTSGVLLTVIALAIFYRSGFYTYGRFYRSRYKALVVAQAVSLSYLLFAFIGYFIFGQLGVPRGALLLSWLLTLALLVTARLWSVAYRRIVEAESQRRTPEREVKNVLVIGGAGFIGSALLPKLLERGYNVRVLDMLLFGEDAIRSVMDDPRVEVVRADFRHVDRVVEAVRGVDAVVHLGAIVGDPACAFDEDLTIEINLMATKMIAEVAKGSGVSRFVFASTCSVYGASSEELSERSALNPVSLYARSKIASERVLLSMAERDFAPTILRFGTIYGLSGRSRFDLVVNLLAAKAVKEGKITVFGGQQWRPFVHVHDAALAVAKALEAPTEAVREEVFNVGSDEQNLVIARVAELVNELVPEAEIVTSGDDVDRRDYRVRFAKIRNVLRFEPEWTIERGIEQVIDAVRSNAIEDYQDPKYSNVKFLRDAGGAEMIPREADWARALLDTEANPMPASAE